MKEDLFMSDDIEIRVQTIIAADLGIDPRKVTPETRIKEGLAADSVDAGELMMAFEEEFNREISDEEAEKVVTVQDAIDLVRKKMAKYFTAG